jgi:HIV Tat-specific factor 1
MKSKNKLCLIERMNTFHANHFLQDASLILECSGKLREHCSKFGAVTKVVVYDKHPSGICQVFFKSPEEADLAISMLDGRLYSKACGPMKCYTWDGKTKYKVTETEEEERERLANWEKFLKDGEAPSSTPATTAASTTQA